jgi:curved DNA-binding protein CbpA
MTPETFRGDPYRALEVAPDASDALIKRRWRQLAREHHPDRAGADAQQAAESTRRMARINAAYELLRDPERRRRYDQAHGGAGHAAAAAGEGPRREGPAGPPPPRPEPPVTARFDTSGVYHRRDTTLSRTPGPLRGQPPISYRERMGEPEPLRASRPNGPVRLRRTGRREPPPSLDEARATVLEFGRFRGHTLGQVAEFEPTYIDWVARTITRDRDLVVRARVIQADLDERGVERRFRPPTPGFGTPRREHDPDRRTA